MRLRAIFKKDIKECRKVKKISIILAMALTLVFAFAVNAMATQNLKNTATSTDTAAASIAAKTSDYAATTTGQTAVTNAMANIGTTSPPSISARIHSHYAENTNACAACHAVHTGVGAYLLQWEGAQKTCEACHDGTTNTYDVYGGQIGTHTGEMTFGGRFGVEGTVTNVSTHGVEGVGTFKLFAAPGGAAAADATKDANGTQWDQSFECMSCHDAHGKAGNFRILSPDVNGYGDTHAVTTAQSKFVSLDTHTFVALNQTDNTFYWFNVPGEYPYRTDAIYADGTKMTYEKDYTLDNTSGYTKVVFKNATPTNVTGSFHPGLKVTGVVSDYLGANEQVQHQSGINDFCGACHTDYNTSRVNYSATSHGNPLNLFYDQNQKYPVKVASGAYNTLSGTYHAAYRHTVGFLNHAGEPGYGPAAKGIDLEYPTIYDQTGTKKPTDVFTCLSCHVAHGTDQTVWAGLEKKTVGVYKGDSVGTTGGYIGFEGEGTNPEGSKLTRMPGFGTCLTCHDKPGANQGMGY